VSLGVPYKRRGSIFRKTSYFHAIESINLEVYSGETLGVVGRNGSGKSTLLYLMGNIIKPDSGTIHFNNVSVSLMSIGIGFEPNLSGKDNAIIGGMLQGRTRREVENNLDAIHEFSELGEFFCEPVRTYSTGMRARPGFSVAYIMRPDVLLLDEILSVGDQHFKKKDEATMREKISSNQTVVLVSHSPEQPKRLCDRILFLDSGKNISLGKPEETLSQFPLN